jgi:hypothetical protein
MRAQDQQDTTAALLATATEQAEQLSALMRALLLVQGRLHEVEVRLGLDA